MSWSVLVIPLHTCPQDVLDWARELALTAVPEQPPPDRALPTVKEFLTGLRTAGCHGTAWYSIICGDDPGLPSCPNQALCDRIPGPDLGEVSIKVEGAESLAAPIRIDDRVTQVAIRKPRGGLQRAVRTLALIGGEQLVFDDSDLNVLVVSPDDTDEDLEPAWPWPW